jgi:ribonuclease Z
LTERAKIFSDLPDYNASPGEAADAARDAGVRALVLTHIVPPLPMKALEGPFLGDAAERFTGPLWMAGDGDLYSLPLGTGAVERTGLIRRGPAG